jgi:lincosamide nucleotidyltransferase A/C/D/E
VNSVQLIELLDCLDDAEVPIWLDGGWGVDALVGEQTRPHRDVDMVIARSDCARAQDALATIGLHHDPGAEPGFPTRLVMLAADGRGVDFHPILFDEKSNGWQELPGGAWCLYPVEGLIGTGHVEGRAVRCITAELQRWHHVGYPLKETDRHDLGLLASHFGLPLPPGVSELQRSHRD